MSTQFSSWSCSEAGPLGFSVLLASQIKTPSAIRGDQRGMELHTGGGWEELSCWRGPNDTNLVRFACAGRLVRPLLEGHRPAEGEVESSWSARLHATVVARPFRCDPTQGHGGALARGRQVVVSSELSSLVDAGVGSRRK